MTTNGVPELSSDNLILLDKLDMLEERGSVVFRVSPAALLLRGGRYDPRLELLHLSVIFGKSLRLACLHDMTSTSQMSPLSMTNIAQFSSFDDELKLWTKFPNQK